MQNEQKIPALDYRPIAVHMIQCDRFPQLEHPKTKILHLYQHLMFGSLKVGQAQHLNEFAKLYQFTCHTKCYIQSNLHDLLALQSVPEYPDAQLQL